MTYYIGSAEGEILYHIFGRGIDMTLYLLVTDEFLLYHIFGRGIDII